MEQIGNLLRSLQQQGALLEPGELALVWIDCPDAGCFVRAGDVRRIEAYFRGKSKVWSRVSVARPDGSTDALVDSRRPKVVAAAVRRAEKQAMKVLLHAIKDRSEMTLE
jgi:hypothetical protein